MATGRINQIASEVQTLSSSPKVARVAQKTLSLIFTGAMRGKQPTTFPSDRKDNQRGRVIRSESRVQRETTQARALSGPSNRGHSAGQRARRGEPRLAPLSTNRSDGSATIWIRGAKRRGKTRVKREVMGVSTIREPAKHISTLKHQILTLYLSVPPLPRISIPEIVATRSSAGEHRTSRGGGLYFASGVRRGENSPTPSQARSPRTSLPIFSEKFFNGSGQPETCKFF